MAGKPLPDSWREISALLDQALDLPRERRAEWLASLRQNDPAIATKVGTWLEELERVVTDDFLENSPAPRMLAGLELGAYCLIEPVGEGGMGTVWRGERSDGRFEQRVAVKVLHAALVRPAGSERFAREANILARLTHPGIAHLIDAGISPICGPYLVLEFVAGEYIDRYCDINRLSLRERLRVFLDVLAPIAHAHANLIVHRDLKPSNVLVTTDGHVKLLDFGIAKLLRTEPARGSVSDITCALTPAYAAPEQLTGDAITTSTDVYALGVLLYEVLTGRHPFAEHASSPAALVDAIVQRAPEKPSESVVTPPRQGDESAASIAARRATSVSKLRQTLAGDLDTIVMTALRKPPAERYPTVTALADDVQRYLRDEPISARAESMTYRARKFARRNRAAVVLAAMALFALVGGLVGTLSQASRATAQRDLARRELWRAEAINDLNAFLIADIAPLGSAFTAGDLLKRAEDIVAQQEDDADGRRVEMLVSIGGLYSTLGETGGATRVLEQAHERSRSADVSLRAKASCELGRALVKTGDVARSRQLVAAALASIPEEPQNALTRMLCYFAAAAVENWSGNGEQAIIHARAAASLIGDAGTSDVVRLRVAMELAESYRIAGRYREANEAFAEAHARLVALGREDTQRGATLLNNWGLTIRSLGQPRESARLLRRALEISQARGSADRVDPVLWANVATALYELGQYAEGITLASRAYDAAQAQGDSIIADQALLGLARLYVANGDVARGTAALDKVEASFRGRFAPDYPGLIAIALDRVRIAEAQGDLNEAARLADRALGMTEGNARRQSYVPAILRQRADIYLKMRRFAEARADAARAIAAGLAQLPAGSHSAGLGAAYLTLGEAHAGEGSTDQARAALKTALEHLQSAAGDDHFRTRRARELLAGR